MVLCTYLRNICMYTTGCFYFTIANLPPRLRARLNAIQAIAFAKSEHISKYGISEVLRCITEDIAKLENVSHFLGLDSTYCTLLGTHFHHKSRRHGATRHNCMCLWRQSW